MNTEPAANLLIVDDDPKTLLAMEALLSGPGRTIVIAASGQEALRWLGGYQALDYFRYRHTDSDLFRVARQQLFVRALKDQINPPDSGGESPEDGTGEAGTPEPAETEPPAEAVPIAALGHWVHVYVDRATRRPIPIPDAIRSLLETAQIE